MSRKIQQEITPAEPLPGKYMMLRHGKTKKPVAYCTVPVPAAFKSMVEGFSEPENCQVKVADCDGTREALAALFRDDAGWRAPNINRGES